MTVSRTGKVQIVPLALMGILVAVCAIAAAVLLSQGQNPRRIANTSTDEERDTGKANSARNAPADNSSEQEQPRPEEPSGFERHSAYYKLDTTEARLAYLDALVKGEEPSSSVFLWDLITVPQDSTVSLRALEVALKIANTREKPEDVAKAFGRAFTAPAAGVRKRAFALIEFYPEPLIVPFLARLLDFPTDDAPAVLVALARIGNWDARESLLKVAKNLKMTKELRVRAIVLLGSLKDTGMRSALQELTQSEDEDIRKATEQALKETSK